MQAESHAVHAIAHLALAMRLTPCCPSSGPMPKPPVVEQPHSDLFDRSTSPPRRLPRPADDAVAAAAHGRPGADLPADGGRELLRAHDNRIYLASDMTAPVKWLSIGIFGVLTQIALLLSMSKTDAPAARGRALHRGLQLLLIVMAVFDAPFEVVLKDEPGRACGRRWRSSSLAPSQGLRSRRKSGGMSLAYPVR